MTTTPIDRPADAPQAPDAARWGHVAPVTCYAAYGRRWRGATPSGLLVYGETAETVHKLLREFQTTC